MLIFFVATNVARIYRIDLAISAFDLAETTNAAVSYSAARMDSAKTPKKMPFRLVPIRCPGNPRSAYRTPCYLLSFIIWIRNSLVAANLLHSPRLCA